MPSANPRLEPATFTNLFINDTCYGDICDMDCTRCDKEAKRCVRLPCFDISVPSQCDCPQLDSETLMMVGAVRLYPRIIERQERHCLVCYSCLT